MSLCLLKSNLIYIQTKIWAFFVCTFAILTKMITGITKKISKNEIWEAKIGHYYVITCNKRSLTQKLKTCSKRKDQPEGGYGIWIPTPPNKLLPLLYDIRSPIWRVRFRYQWPTLTHLPALHSYFPDEICSVVSLPETFGLSLRFQAQPPVPFRHYLLFLRQLIQDTLVHSTFL